MPNLVCFSYYMGRKWQPINAAEEFMRPFASFCLCRFREKSIFPLCTGHVKDLISSRISAHFFWALRTLSLDNLTPSNRSERNADARDYMKEDSFCNPQEPQQGKKGTEYREKKKGQSRFSESVFWFTTRFFISGV